MAATNNTDRDPSSYRLNPSQPYLHLLCGENVSHQHAFRTRAYSVRFLRFAEQIFSAFLLARAERVTGSARPHRSTTQFTVEERAAEAISTVQHAGAALVHLHGGIPTLGAKRDA